MNWLLRPWLTPKLELTAIDEILGALEVLFLAAVLLFIYASVSNMILSRRLKKKSAMTYEKRPKPWGKERRRSYPKD